MSFEQKRSAERLPLDEPIAGTASGSPVTIVELSAIGCKIEHKEKLSIGGTTMVRFKWEGKQVELRAKVARTQLRAGMVYESGLQFATSLDEAPEVMRDIVASLASEDLPVDFEDLVITPPPVTAWIECRLVEGKWQRRPVSAVHQPDEGFITLPADDGELDLLCKTYEYADPDTRRLIRISLELAATQKRD